MLELEPLLVVVELLGPNRLSSAAVASSEVAALRYESSLDSMESTRDRTFREGAKGHVKESEPHSPLTGERGEREGVRGMWLDRGVDQA